MIHQGTKTIETDRLILRAFRAEDGEPMFRNWASDPEVTRFLTWPTHGSVAVTERVVESWVSRNSEPASYHWAIVLKELGEPIGSISAVKTDDRTESATIGYCIGRRWWGQGITAEALRAVIAFFFEEVGMYSVSACHDPRNPNSGKVMRKSGMTYEGTWRAGGVNNQGVCDEAWYSILKPEYEEAAAEKRTGEQEKASAEKRTGEKEKAAGCKASAAQKEEEGAQQEGKCILICAGDLTLGEVPRGEKDLVIAVDGGLGYCELLQVEPDLVLGDFDSLSQSGEEAVKALEKQIPDRILRLPTEKDDTDTLAAIKEGLSRGYRDFRIYGGMGGRLEHTVANIQCLLYLKNRGAVGYLVDGGGMAFVIRDEKVSFREGLEGYLSLFSLTETAKGVTLEGLKYPLNEATVRNEFPIGISNEFTGKAASVRVAEGDLLCILTYAAE